MELSFRGQVRRRHGFVPPDPLAAGAGFAALALLTLAVGLVGVVAPSAALAIAGIFVGAGALRSALVYHDLVGLRRMADRELRRQPPVLPTSDLAAWRSDDLTSTRRRAALARSVERTENDVSPVWLPGASPLNRVALRAHADLLHALALRLRAFDRPIAASAVLEVQELLTDADSPLYARDRAADLRPSMQRCLIALDESTGSGHGFSVGESSDSPDGDPLESDESFSGMRGGADV